MNEFFLLPHRQLTMRCVFSLEERRYAGAVWQLKYFMRGARQPPRSLIAWKSLSASE